MPETGLSTKDSKETVEEPKKKEPPNEDRYFAITGGIVHTMADGVLHGAAILSKNGKIERIGRSITWPESTEVLDADGYHVYPGLIAVSSGNPLGAEPPDDTTNVYSLPMTLALAGGITTAVSGNTAAKLTYGTLDDMLVKRELFKSLSYSTSDAKARHELRARFDKVRRYLRDLEAYEEKKKTDPTATEPEKDWLKGEYKAAFDLMRREATALATANNAHEILELCELATRYGISIVVRGALEGWTVAPRMARAGLSAIVTLRPGLFSMGADEPDKRLNRPNGRSIENAAVLHKHGVSVAIIPSNDSITTWGLAGRDLLHLNMEAAFAVRGGLPDDAAQRAITIDAARILGIAHRVGSIEVGKDADFVITDGDILHYMTQARWTIVNGRIAYDKAKESLLSHIRPGGDLDAPPPDDYWPRRLGTVD